MTTKLLIAADGAYITSADGNYIVAANSSPMQPLVTPNTGRLTSKARHIQARSGSTVVARSSGKDIYARGGTQPLVTPGDPFSVG